MSLVQYLNEYKYKYTVKETGKEIWFKPITTGQLKNLLTYEGNKDPYIIETVLDDIITNCVITDDFDLDTFTLQDRFDLLLEIRRKTKGNMYSFSFKCPECDMDNIKGVDLGALEVVPYPTELENIIEIDDNFRVHIDYIRRSTQKKAINDIRDMKLSDNQKLAEVATRMYAYSMLKFFTPDGIKEDVDIVEKIELLDSLGESVYQKISDWYTDYTFGVVFKTDVGCNHCDYKKEMEIPFTSFFD